MQEAAPLEPPLFVLGNHVACAGAVRRHNGVMNIYAKQHTGYDVIVCGGGTAGLPAAIGAARQGARVALIERYGFLGGTAAFSIMPAWHGMIENGSGLLMSFAERVADLGIGPNPLQNRHIEPEVVKYLFQALAQEEKIDLYLHRLVTGVEMESQAIKGVMAESKSGRELFRGTVIVDATGDGDVCAWSGAPFEKGDAGRMQGMALRFRIGFVDLPRYLDWAIDHIDAYRGRTPEQLLATRARAEAGLDFYLGSEVSQLWEQDTDQNLPRNTYFVLSSIRPSEVSINATRVYDLDGTDADDLTTAEVTCRDQVYAIWRWLRRNVSGFENSVVTETAVQVGVRESRTITGDYVLTDADCRATREFDDAVLTSPISYDAHDKQKYETFHLRGGMVDIPYRCFLPQGRDGLLVVGRCMSSDHLANSAVRQMKTAFQAGEVGGIAAALAARQDVAPRDLPLNVLVPVLKDAGIMTSQQHRREMGRHLMQFLEQEKVGSRDHEHPG
jgi:hypothetical protein